MARYNHFAQKKYPQISFAELSIGDKFRTDTWEGKRARRDIVMIKTSTHLYQEYRSHKEHTLVNPEKKVSDYNKIEPPKHNKLKEKQQ